MREINLLGEILQIHLSKTSIRVRISECINASKDGKPSRGDGLLSYSSDGGQGKADTRAMDK
jgi:hypothetical protein